MPAWPCRSSLGAVVNAAWLFAGLRRGGWYAPAAGWGRFVASVVLAAALMGAVLFVAETPHRLGRPGRPAACCGSAG